MPARGRDIPHKDIDLDGRNEACAGGTGCGVPTTQQRRRAAFQRASGARMIRLDPIEQLHGIIAAGVITRRRGTDDHRRIGQHIEEVARRRTERTPETPRGPGMVQVAPTGQHGPDWRGVARESSNRIRVETQSVHHMMMAAMAMAEAKLFLSLS